MPLSLSCAPPPASAVRPAFMVSFRCEDGIKFLAEGNWLRPTSTFWLNSRRDPYCNVAVFRSRKMAEHVAAWIDEFMPWDEPRSHVQVHPIYFAK